MKIKLSILLFFICLSASAQSFDRAKMDSLFAFIENNNRGMGSLSIYQDGKEVYHNATGYASINDSIKANEKTKYRIGSISKTFTASIIMQLVEEDKLTLDTKLSEFYPEITNAKDITVEHLLRHRSGIFNFTNKPSYMAWMESPVTKSQLVDTIASNGTVFTPGEKSEYSNSNYVLLSFIAEDIEGKSLSQIIEERITKPLHLENTYYGSRIDVDKHEALSYMKLNDWELGPETDMSVPSGAGAIVSNPSDLNQFLDLLFNDQVVSSTALENMMTLTEGFGMGMFEYSFEDKKAYGHAGGIDGFRSKAFYFPEEKVSIAYTSNGSVMAMDEILDGVMRIYFGYDYELPVLQKAIEISSEELDQYLGTYSSPGFPLKITFTKDGSNLIAQATGQPAITMEAYEKHKFRFEPAMVKIEFIPEESKMVLRQGGGEFELTRE